MDYARGDVLAHAFTVCQ